MVFSVLHSDIYIVCNLGDSGVYMCVKSDIIVITFRIRRSVSSIYGNAEEQCCYDTDKHKQCKKIFTLNHKCIVRETALIICAEYRIFTPFNILVKCCVNGIIRVCALAYIMKDNWTKMFFCITIFSQTWTSPPNSVWTGVLGRIIKFIGLNNPSGSCNQEYHYQMFLC